MDFVFPPAPTLPDLPDYSSVTSSSSSQTPLTVAQPPESPTCVPRVFVVSSPTTAPPPSPRTTSVFASETTTTAAATAAPTLGEGGGAKEGEGDGEEGDEAPAYTSWDDMDIPVPLLRGIFSVGFERPSPIQQRAIVPMLKGRDVFAQAQSGTGKTAAFGVGALSRVDVAVNGVQAILLSHSRELALQTADTVIRLGSMMPGLRVQTMYGGSAYELGDAGGLPHVVCGCPGRVRYMLEQRKMATSSLRVVVIDEVDAMLSEANRDTMQYIFGTIPRGVQIAFFSATIPVQMMSIVNQIMQSPVHIAVKQDMLTLEGIKQYYVAIDDDPQKYNVLVDLYTKLAVSQCIIFCNSVPRVEKLYTSMKKDNFPVCRIHGQMLQPEREACIQKFRAGEYRVLISSDLTSRGFDVQQVSVVINFDVPKCGSKGMGDGVHTYLHRIGRSGRWGRKGTAINFVTQRDIPYLKAIETHYHTQIEELPAEF